jgi:16S rRNA (uracil1498-N3)-methyltransferase
MELFFTYSDNISDYEATFNESEARHILKTMRKKLNDILHFTDGMGRLYQGEITRIKPNLTVKHTLLKHENGPLITLTIGVGFIRHPRMDFVIEKGTELGVNKFILFSSEYSQYFTQNIVHWQRIAQQAIKQSLRYHLPQIITMANFQDFLKWVKNIKHKYLAELRASQKITELVKTINLSNGDDIIIVIGPEGGFSEKELKAAQRHGFQSVSFGDYRLRTETAVLSAASFINLFRN